MLTDNTLLDNKRVADRFVHNKQIEYSIISILSKKYNNQYFMEEWLLRELKFEANLRRRFAEIEQATLERARSRLKKALDYSSDDIDYISYTDVNELTRTLAKEMIALYLMGGRKAFAELEVGYAFNIVDQSIVGFDITNIPAAVDNLTSALQEALGSGLIDERTIASRASKIANLVKNNYDPRIKEAIVETMKQRLGPDGLYSKLKQVFKDGYKINVPAKYNEAGKLVRRAYSYTISTEKYAATVARTESLRWANEGKLAGYEQMGVVQKVIFYTALDSSVCPVCFSLHGKVFTVQEAHGVIPIHANCRCFVDFQVPIYTSKGWKRICDIKIGNLVLTHTGKFRKVVKVMPRYSYRGDVITVEYRIENKFKNGINKIFKITTTPEHPYLTERGWIASNKLRIGNRLRMLAKECKECGTLFPINRELDYGNYCSQKCVSRYITREQYKDDAQRKLRSVYARRQMKREYANGTRDRFEITKKAHEALRSMPKKYWKLRIQKKKEKYARLGIPWHTEAAKAKLSKARMGIGNPMHKSKHSKAYWKKNSEMRKQYYCDHPKKHPNVILAQRLKKSGESKGFSQGQLLVYENIKKKYKTAKMNYPILTSVGYKYVDVGISSLKIAVEYDSRYWHQDVKRDKIRDKLIEKQGWTIIHIWENKVEEGLMEFYRIAKNHSSDYKFLYVDIVGLRKFKRKNGLRLYNFSVEKDESYIVNGIVTHNCTWVPDVEDFLKKSIVVPEDVRVPQSMIDLANENIANLYDKPVNVLAAFGIMGQFSNLKNPDFPKFKSKNDVIKYSRDILKSVIMVLGNRITVNLPMVNFVTNDDEFQRYVRGYIGNREGNGFYIPKRDSIIINAGASDKWEYLLYEFIWQFIYSYQKYGQKNPNLINTLAFGFTSFLTYHICKFSNGTSFKKGRFYDHANAILNVLSNDKFRRFYIADRIVLTRGIGNKTKKILSALLSYLPPEKVSGVFGTKNPNIVIPKMMEILKNDFVDDELAFVNLIDRLQI